MKILRVTGLGRVTVPPDRIAVRFAIAGRAAQFDRAVEEASRRVAALQKATAASDLNPDDLKTAAYRIEEDTEYRDGRHVRVGFACHHELLIVLPMDSKGLTRLIERVMAARVEARTSFSFQVADASSPPLLALEAATRNARARAEGIAGAAGLKIGQIQRIEHGTHAAGISSTEHPLALATDLCASEASLPDFRPDELTFEEEVSVEWEVAPAT